MLFDDIASVYVGANELSINADNAMNRLMELRRQYDALAPDWTQAPEEVQWYTIDADGFACWNIDEPLMGSSMWSSVRRMYSQSIPIPIGIDWRLCKWQRP